MFMRLAILIPLLTGLAGCGWFSRPPASTQPSTHPTTQPEYAVAPPPQESQKDAVPEQDYLVQLLTYRITLPYGAVSRNENFWKHINEQTVDVATYDRLYKNGVRVGVAPTEEWDYLKDLLDHNPSRSHASAYAGREGRDIELEMKMKVNYQIIFHFGPHGLRGQTFEEADNLFRLWFMPAPRKHGSVRITLCPVVRSVREVLAPLSEVRSRASIWMRPEQLFDLNLITDVPLNNFLVVAPSPEGQWSSSLGNTFLTQDAPTQRTETLLIFKPIVFRQKIDPLRTDGPMAPATLPTK